MLFLQGVKGKNGIKNLQKAKLMKELIYLISPFHHINWLVVSAPVTTGIARQTERGLNLKAQGGGVILYSG